MTAGRLRLPFFDRVVWRYGLAVGSVGVALGVRCFLGEVSMFAAHSSLLPLLLRLGLVGWSQVSLPYSFHFVSLGYFFQPLVPYVELAGIRVPYRVLSLTAFASLALIVCWLSASRRRAEEALRESEQRWRSLTEALPQLVWGARPDGGATTSAPSGQTIPASGRATCSAGAGWKHCIRMTASLPGNSGRNLWPDDSLMTWNTVFAGATGLTVGSRRAERPSGTATERS